MNFGGNEHDREQPRGRLPGNVFTSFRDGFGRISSFRRTKRPLVPWTLVKEGMRSNVTRDLRPSPRGSIWQQRNWRYRTVLYILSSMPRVFHGCRRENSFRHVRCPHIVISHPCTASLMICGDPNYSDSKVQGESREATIIVSIEMCYFDHNYIYVNYISVRIFRRLWEIFARNFEVADFLKNFLYIFRVHALNSINKQIPRSSHKNTVIPDPDIICNKQIRFYKLHQFRSAIPVK